MRVSRADKSGSMQGRECARGSLGAISEAAGAAQPAGTERPGAGRFRSPTGPCGRGRRDAMVENADNHGQSWSKKRVQYGTAILAIASQERGGSRWDSDRAGPIRAGPGQARPPAGRPLARARPPPIAPARLDGAGPSVRREMGPGRADLIRPGTGRAGQARPHAM